MEKIKVKTALLLLSYLVSLTGFLSIFRFIDPVFLLSFLLMVILGIYFDLKKKYPLPRYILNLISLLVVIFMFFSVNLSDPVTPVAQTLLILLGIKLIENKKFRDFMQIYTISVFLLAGSALMSLDMIFLLFFTALYFLIVLSMILLTFVTQDENITFPVKVFLKIIFRSILIPLISIPVTVLIFLILPRTEYPVFNFLIKQSSGKSGFSDIVQLGDVSSIQEDDSVAFRVVMDKIDESQLYWRGATLNYFDGRSWLRISANDGRSYLNGRRIVQEIILEPQENRYLFSLDKPFKFHGIPGKMESDLSFSAKKISFTRIKYRVSSVLTESVETDSIDRQIYLQIPKGLSRDIIDLGYNLKGSTQVKTLENILRFIEKNYRFSLKDLPDSKDPLWEFLFDKKYGNCEYFASSVAVLLRINGIPSRLVVGYKGGFYNDIGKYYIVPQKFAHTWVEAYINGRWLRIDPTPVGTYRNYFSNNFSDNAVKRFIETLHFLWINFIVNFDIQKQVGIINKIKGIVEKPDFTGLGWYFILPFIIILLLLLVYLSLKNYHFLNEEDRILRYFLNKMEKKGYRKYSYEGLEEFVSRIDDPDLREKAFKFVKLFEECYYKDKNLDKKALKDILSSI